MIEQPYKSIHFDWISESGDKVRTYLPDDFTESGWISYPIPPETGCGGYELLDLALGTTLVRSTITFAPKMLGKWSPPLDVNAEFKETTFQAMTVRGIRGNVTEKLPPIQVAISEGIDLFRLTDHYISTFTADATFSGEAFHMSIGQSTLNKLIGENVAESLLKRLNLSHAPSAVVRPIPLHVSQHMINATAHALTGEAKKLFSQAKALEYLSALIHHVCSDTEPTPDHSHQSRQRVQSLRDQLLHNEGKLPRLEEIAEQYGRSAKHLNEEFQAEYGQTIYAFVFDQRLQQAHSTLENSLVPIKSIAAALGYSHTSNFSIAFRRKFGYPPGSLRKNRS